MHNQYQIARMLGHGGFGITYLAWDTLLEIKLAIKEYMPRDFATRNSTNAEVSTFAGDAKENFAYGLERFLEEARTLAKFQQHAGIVSVLNFFKANGTGYSSKAKWAATQDLMLKFGGLSKGVDDVSVYYTNEFLPK